MTLAQQIITISMVVLGTMITRFLPFLIFPSDKPTPKYVQYLGRTFPSAVLGLLVIYSLKDVSFFSNNHGIPEILSILVVIILHIWKKNMFLSIATGTALYMFLIQLIF